MTTRPAKHLFALSILGCLVLVGCRAEDPAPTPAAEPEASAASETGAAADAEAGVPKIASDAPVFEFGEIKPTDTIEHVFKVKNEGTADLKIERVQRT
jgi:hypothetical protein